MGRLIGIYDASTRTDGNKQRWLVVDCNANPGMSTLKWAHGGIDLIETGLCTLVAEFGAAQAGCYQTPDCYLTPRSQGGVSHNFTIRSPCRGGVRGVL